jgi:hypothetical protein
MYHALLHALLISCTTAKRGYSLVETKEAFGLPGFLRALNFVPIGRDLHRSCWIPTSGGLEYWWEPHHSLKVI